MTSFIVSGQAASREQQGFAVIQELPAPVGGWNTRDAYSVVPSFDALIMDNVIPNVAEPDSRQGSLTSRNGFESYATGLGDDVETLATFDSGASEKFLGAAAGNIYNITSSGAVGAALGSGFTNARWQWENFGARLFLVNGADAPQIYDGSTLGNMTISGSGLTPANLIGVKAHKSRLYFIEKDTANYWYGGVDTISGTWSKVDLSFVANEGGTLTAIQTWTRDGGSGPDDYIVFIMSTGETLIYAGSNPADADNWALVGRYKIGKPLGRRCAISFAGDVVVMTTSGFILLSEAITKAEAKFDEPKLAGAANKAARDYESNYGWQALHYPRKNLLLFNVPIQTDSTYHQYILNTINRAPARFKGQNGRCWGIYNGDLYFGGNGVVYKADTGLDDNGTNIDIDVQWGFSNLGTPARKTFMEFMPILDADGNVSFTYDLAYDYGSAKDSSVATSSSSGTPWGSPWGSPWSPENVTRTDPQAAVGDGVSVSLRMRASLSGQRVSIHGLRYSYEIQNII